MKAPAKHCRLDSMPTWFVKRAAAQFVPILATLCNASFQAGSLPTSQKHALVSARLKKPQLDPADTNSYRPILQLSFASKLVEQAVATRFVQHCTQNSQLPARQSAYRRHFSTETALLIVHNDIVRAVDRCDLVLLVLIDLSAAFDTVDHGCLLSILERRFCVFLPTTSSYTQQFDCPKCLQVVSIWCPASATCSSGVRLDGCS